MPYETTEVRGVTETTYDQEPRMGANPWLARGVQASLPASIRRPRAVELQLGPDNGLDPQMLLRLGFGPPLDPTPRRPVEETMR